MLAVEHLGPSAHAHGHELLPSAWTAQTPSADVELSQLENEQGIPHFGSETPIPALPLTLGMVIHGLADGLALGVSALPSNDNQSSGNLSLVVFMALAVHKGECTPVTPIRMTDQSYQLQPLSHSLSRYSPPHCHEANVASIYWYSARRHPSAPSQPTSYSISPGSGTPVESESPCSSRYGSVYPHYTSITLIPT